MRPDGARDPVAGPDSGPQQPFPIRLSGPVIKGFGRGSKELGIPTANIPADALSEYPDLETGVYYGVAALDPSKYKYASSGAAGEEETNGSNAASSPAATILPCVLSIGYNPFYKNTVRSVEIHILPPLNQPPTTTSNNTEPITTTPSSKEKTLFNKLPDFYGTPLNLLILGYIRPEFDYVSLEALVDDIRIDCEVARASLLREKYVVYLSGEDEIAPGRLEEEKAVREGRKWLRTF
ncbi:hypothetical protein AJ80_06704 [Polytolypa hystricis UAMH7299]|uniref:Riboflavin kinase n=1 Tax=Polytolypa hystricis (strain UAMH7299) TaxID=1447883 RepID=A0A2B7XUU8_POLH7|nr:hypothetical protein AJ80_06704 [Polytolypa hystricis UAMH7299]